MNIGIIEEFFNSASLFRGKRILVIGDIALDRTFLCDPALPGRHAVHAGESIIDVRAHGDDHGSIGAAHNACMLAASLGADSLLVTLTGDDPEADRVAQLLAAAGTRAKQIRIPGIQTVTRFRFFVHDTAAGRFALRLRVDKDPDVEASYRKAEEQLCTPSFLDWWEKEAEASDVVFVSDTDKGFLSARVLAELVPRIHRASGRRVAAGKGAIPVIVDPKRDWAKYAGLAIDLFKPNDVEAAGAVQLPRQDWSDDASLATLAERIWRKHGGHFPEIVVTLAEQGAALIRTGGTHFTLHRFPAIPPREASGGIAMHCGDMFGSALALSRCIEDDMTAAIPFANYVASLQVSKPIGQKITRGDLLDANNIRHCRDSARPFSLVTEAGSTAHKRPLSL